MRRQQDALARPAGRSEPDQKIRAAGKDFLELHIESGPRGAGGEEIGHALFARARIVEGQKGRVHARKRDEFAKKFGGVAHVGSPQEIAAQLNDGLGRCRVKRRAFPHGGCISASCTVHWRCHSGTGIPPVRSQPEMHAERRENIEHRTPKGCAPERDRSPGRSGFDSMNALELPLSRWLHSDTLRSFPARALCIVS